LTIKQQMKVAEPKSSTSSALQHSNSAPLFQPEARGAAFFGGKSQPHSEAAPFGGEAGIQAKCAECEQEDKLQRKEEQEEQAAPEVQAKLKIGAPDDAYEKQADAVADQVVQRLANPTPVAPSGAAALQRQAAPAEDEKIQEKPEELESAAEQVQMKPIFDSAATPPDDGDSVQRKPESGAWGMVQMKCAACEQEDPGKLQRKPGGSGETSATPDFSARLQSSKGGGSPLPANVSSSMGDAMGADFSNVRVHTGSEAAGMSDSIQAQAFTHGNDVYFNEGKYSPGSSDGQRLLAHELVHTVQQGGASSSVQKDPAPTPALPPARPTSAIDITHRFDPDERWRAYLEQTRGNEEVPVKIGEDYEGTIVIRRNTRRDVTNRAGGYELVSGRRRYLDATGMRFLDPLHPILYLNNFGPEGQTTGFLSIRVGNEALGNVLGLIRGINQNLEAMRFLGLSPIQVPDGGINNVFENGRLVFEVSQLSTIVDGYVQAGGGIGIVGGTFTFNLNATITIEGVAEGEFTLSRAESGGLSGRANIEANIANVTASLLVEYVEGVVTIQGTGRIQSEKFSGQITLLVTDSVRSRQMMHAALGIEAMDAAAESAEAPTAKTPRNQVLAGWGEVTATITPWLEGTARVGIDSVGHVTMIGELVVTEEVELMEQRLRRIELFETEIRAGYGIPLLAQVFLFARLRMFINAGLGPLVLRDIRLTGTYSTDPTVMQQFSITGTLAINAFAVLALAIEAGAGLTLLGHDLTAGINGTAAAGIRAYALATPTFEYAEQAAPEGGKVGESHLRGHFEAAAQLFLQLSGSLFYEIDSPWWSPVPDGREDYPLGEIQYPIGDSIGIGADVDWLVGSSEVPELTMSPVEFDPSQFTSDVLADPPPGRQGNDEANPDGAWQDGNAPGNLEENPQAEGGGDGVPHGSRQEENLHNLPDEQRYMRGLADISEIAESPTRPSLAQVRSRINRAKNRYNLDQARIDEQNDDNVTVYVSNAQQNNRDHPVVIPIVSAAEQERLGREAVEQLNARLNSQAGEAGTISQADARTLSHEWQQAHPIVESVRVVDGRDSWDYQVDFGEHNQRVQGKGKAESSDDSIQDALREIDTEGTQKSADGELTREDAEQIKANVNRDHPSVIEISSVTDGGTTWDFEYVQRAEKKVSRKKLAKGDNQKILGILESGNADAPKEIVCRSGTLNDRIGGEVGDGMQAHHLISCSVAQRSVFALAAAESGYDINRSENGILLPSSRQKWQYVKKRSENGLGLPLHRGGHINEYYNKVERVLGRKESAARRAKQNNTNWSDTRIVDEMERAESEIRDALINYEILLSNQDPSIA